MARTKQAARRRATVEKQRKRPKKPYNHYLKLYRELTDDPKSFDKRYIPFAVWKRCVQEELAKHKTFDGGSYRCTKTAVMMLHCDAEYLTNEIFEEALLVVKNAERRTIHRSDLEIAAASFMNRQLTTYKPHDLKWLGKPLENQEAAKEEVYDKLLADVKLAQKLLFPRRKIGDEKTEEEKEAAAEEEEEDDGEDEDWKMDEEEEKEEEEEEEDDDEEEEK